MEPYYADESVTLYHGDCRQIAEWLAADVLVTDPPYGRSYRRQRGVWKRNNNGPNSYVMPAGRPDRIEGDSNTSLRDHVLRMWLVRPAVMFGSLQLPPPAGTRQVLIWRAPPDAGQFGTFGGFRHDVEAVYLTGSWKCGFSGRSSLIETAARCAGSPTSYATRYGHPHAKPVDVLETLIAACPPGIIADPFAGAGSTLVAARNLGRKAIGVEIDERYCERTARRLSQGILVA